jgi:hypothetical protein
VSEQHATAGEEFEIEAGDELLWRQINPAFVDGGKVTSQAFTPTEKDRGELSTNRSSKVTAEAAFRHYTEIQGHKSVGVYAVSVDEVLSVELRAVDDFATEEGAKSPGHAYIDFKHIEATKRRKKIGGKLRDLAESRGWQYGPVE